ncbi:hypothetical protein [Chamaesiphon sp. VAR_69_metabat_338]|nr:hypothetical protein [Chamaesiphon sp. VAR_69_metabat_338]
MGGKLFNCGRIDRDRYLDIEADIRTYLDRVCIKYSLTLICV